MKKVYSTTTKQFPAKKRRRRIGEYSSEIKIFKASMSIDEKIKAELNLINLIGFKSAKTVINK